MSAPKNPPAFPQMCADALDVGMVHEGMTLRDWFSVRAPEPHWRFMLANKPKAYNPAYGEGWSDEACNAAHEAEAAWELARDIAWRFHWADAMLEHRELAKSGIDDEGNALDENGDVRLAHVERISPSIFGAAR